MEYGVVYRAEFRDRNNGRCRVDVLKEGYSGAVTVCVADVDPVTIEYQEVGIDDVFQKSNCAFSLISETNFQFVDLYTTSMVGYRVEVWREHVLLWRGYVDSEQYSEPFDALENYAVSVTASDVGILDRIKTDRYEGLVMVSALLVEANGKMGGLFDRIVFATELKSGTDTFDRLYVSRSSFYNAEDNEYLSYKEVIENVLLPGGLIAVQHRGEWVMTDRDGLYKDRTDSIAYKGDGSFWGGDVQNNRAGDLELMSAGSGSVLGVAPTYNNVKVTFDPQVDDKLMDGKILKLRGLVRTHRYYVGTEGDEGKINGFDWQLYSDASSTLVSANKSWAEYVGIKPYLSGSEEKYLFIPGPARTLDSNHGKLMELAQKPYVAKTDGNNQLRLKIEYLLDVRYNYFEPGGKSNGGENEWRYHNQDTCFVYVPIKLYVKGGNGEVVCYWDNYNVYDSHKADALLKGRWVMGSVVPVNRCFACYYAENRNKNTGIDGWTVNSSMIGHYQQGSLPSLIKRQLNKGDLIPMPPVSGNLVLEIWDGVEMFGIDRVPVSVSSRANYKWIGVRSASVEVVDSDGLGLSTDSIEYSAWIDKQADEKLEIDTVFGSNIDRNANAKGNYYRKVGNGYEIAVDFTRNGETGPIEKHLINTIYSNSGERMHVLEINVLSLFDWGYRTYERWFPGKKFMPIYRSMNVGASEEELKLVEFHENGYTLNEIEING